MSEYASFEDITAAADDGDRDVTLSDGKTVRVRGLSRFEYFLAGNEDPNVFETNLLAIGVEEPKLSAKQVEAWRKTPGRMNDVGAVSDRIRKLTGIGEGADKSDVREVREQS